MKNINISICCIFVCVRSTVFLKFFFHVSLLQCRLSLLAFRLQFLNKLELSWRTTKTSVPVPKNSTCQLCYVISWLDYCTTLVYCDLCGCNWLVDGVVWMSWPTVIQSQSLESTVVDDFSLVQHSVVDVVDLVAWNWFDMTSEDRTAMRVDRRQYELRQVTSYTPAPNRYRTSIIYCTTESQAGTGMISFFIISVENAGMPATRIFHSRKFHPLWYTVHPCSATR